MLLTNLHSAICVIRLRDIYGRIVKEPFTLSEPFGPFVDRAPSGEKIVFQGLDLVENLRESGHWQGFSSAQLK